ncbi:hypothetical protein WG66_012287 [Moniliophthora roreri]|nr:hypothetical protein WG66_012287 [Moniliophthora roreri]
MRWAKFAVYQVTLDLGKPKMSLRRLLYADQRTSSSGCDISRNTH